MAAQKPIPNGFPNCLRDRVAHVPEGGPANDNTSGLERVNRPTTAKAILYTVYSQTKSGNRAKRVRTIGQATDPDPRLSRSYLAENFGFSSFVFTPQSGRVLVKLIIIPSRKTFALFKKRRLNTLYRRIRVEKTWSVKPQNIEKNAGRVLVRS